jgi:molybdenum cofactor synthesis domain-containing protein
MTHDRTPTAAILVIGNEILSGRTRDANLPFLAHALGEIGIRVAEARIVPDEEDAIVQAVNALRSAHDYVFTSGGIGPTHDDITASSIAKAFHVKLARNPQAVKLLQDHYQEADLNPMRLRMAEIPEGATLIENPVSRAPGFTLGNVHVMAGVPAILQAMFSMLRPELEGGPPLLSRTVRAFVAEGDMAARLKEIQDTHFGVTIGSYPFIRHGRLGTSIVVRGTEKERITRVAKEVAELMLSLGGEPHEQEGEERT